MDASSGAGDIDDVNSELEVMSLSAKNDALVLLFKYARASDSSPESRDMPDLEAACPGLLKVVTIPNRKPLVAVLPFCNWDVAAKAVVGLWELRLQGVHFFTPELPEEDQDNGAYKRRVHRELKEVFLGYLATLESGEAVSKCKSELESLKNDLLKIQQKLKRRNSVALWTQLSAEKSDTLMQIQMMAEQLAEYLNGLKSLELAIHSRCSERHEYVDEINDETLLLRLGNDWTWHQLHCMMERETCRFKERLPLYAKRGDILRHIHNNQVLVLNGETGSGKSTQLVQYMVDAGFIKDGFSVVCTQPRRVAVMTLFERVNEESKGCSRLDPLVGHLTSPAFRTEHFPKIMYITDHTLLQLCLVDENFSQFGCVIVDEAHERSLNTDLLLAMLKKCLPKRPDLKVIIMSATADAALLSSYFGGCIMYQVVGRSFPVRFIYEAGEEDDLQDTDNRQRHPGYSRHALQVMHKVASINSGSEEGDVLAFLTSQAEIEWACSQHFGSSAIVLPLHGRLQAGEQQLVFKTTPDGMRKIVFATNVAETSLTIPGIKFVVDCGLAKESCVDPRTGMNILKVCKIDRSAAMQRAGRAGRTQAGVCYRLYSRLDFEAMAPHRMPEILRVHLGVAVLKLMALGVQKIESFDFIDSPNPAAISLAVENLRQLGAIATKDGKTHLTSLGWQLAKLGGDPRLAFIALKSISEGLGREGLVIAGLLSCSGSIFFRAGSDEEKLRSDCLKMRFCHPYGDIFTLLSVYQEWDMVPESRRNKWCVQNSINAKSMRRCRDCVKEMEGCLKTELQVDVSPLWTWSVNASEDCNVMLRKVLISAMPKNLAVFSGHECLGYDVVCFGKQAFLHPSSSLLVFGQSPVWVVFGELLCTSREFLTSVTVVEPEWLSEITPLLPYDIPALLSSRMSKTVIPSLSRCLLSRICGRSNVALKFLTKKIQQGGHQRCLLEADYEKQEFLTKKTQQGDHQRCILEADYEKQEFHLYTTLDLMEGAEILVKDVIKQEKRWLNNECIEKCVFQAALGKSSPVMLFGAGAEIRQVLMQGEYASIEISNVDTEIEDREILSMFDKCAEGIAGFRRVSSPGNGRKWGTVTFCSPKGAAEAVSFLHNAKVGKRRIEVKPSITSNPNERCRPLFPAVRATLTWPRRQTKGHAMVCCRAEDQNFIIRSCSGMLIRGSRILCKPDFRAGDKGIFIHGLGTEVTETELQQVLQQTTGCTLEDVFIPRRPPSDQPTIEACREALVQEIQRFVPLTKFQAHVTGIHLDYVSKAVVKFDENEHEGAASAIAYLQGRTLSICKPWQTISCQETFFSSVQCSGAIYSVLKEDISDLVLALKQQNEGAELTLTRGGNGGCFVQISAGSLRTVAGCKSALEKLIEGMVVADGVDEAELRLLFTRDGLQMVKSVELQTRTHIVCDKRSQTVRVFGPTERKNRALKRLVRNLSQLQERKKCHEIELRGGKRPYGLMREIVRKFGVDLVGLKVLVEGACLSLDHRRHILLIRGSREDVSKVEKTVEEVAWALRGSECCTSFEAFNSEDCRICFCEVEDKYSLVGCGHGFCRACVREQIMSAIRHREGFPLTCAYPDCSQRLLLSDLEVLLTVDQQEELGKASLSAFVALNRGKYRFCTTPDCPAVYRVTDQSELFTCGACSVRLCTSCHVEFHFGLTCDQYEEFKQDPDLSLKSWRKGKQHVKCCPSCGSTIEKVDGCNHVLCNCKTHLCWLCLSPFQSSEDCYSHLQNMHGGFA